MKKKMGAPAPAGGGPATFVGSGEVKRGFDYKRVDRKRPQGGARSGSEGVGAFNKTT